jgi:hypothetical protein
LREKVASLEDTQRFLQAELARVQQQCARVHEEKEQSADRLTILQQGLASAHAVIESFTPGELVFLSPEQLTELATNLAALLPSDVC